MICKGELDWMEVMLGAMTGVMRNIRKRSKGSKFARFGDYAGGNWERNIESACAEKFVAKMLDLRHHDGTDGATDVGPHQVRQTSNPDGKLILHPDDDDGEAFILVVGSAPFFEMKGWCYGAEGKLAKYWDPKAQTPAFFVPREALHDMDELPTSPEGVARQIEADLFAREVLN